MGFPRPAYYTIEELTECWKISVDMIEKYTERGQLQYCSQWYNSYHDGICWESGNIHPEGADENNHTGFWSFVSIYYKLEEVERFEREEGIPRLKPLDAIIINKTDNSTPQASETKNVNSFKNTGDFWAVTYDCKTKHLRMNDRIKYIAYLLDSPGREWEYGDLYELVAKKGSLDDMGKLEKDKNENHSNVNISQLSDEEKQTWENIINEAFAKLQDAVKLNEPEEIRKLQDAYDKIKKTFKNDLGGLITESDKGVKIFFRDRLDPEEKKFYDNVRKQIVKAIRQIKDGGLPDLADHLNDFIKKYNRYQPPPENPKWDVKM